MKLLQVAEQNKKYYTKEFIHGFNTGAKNQYEADKKEAERRGRWVKVAEGWGSLWKCDQCGEMTVETVMGKPRANYCPNCGARMSGEQEKRQ